MHILRLALCATIVAAATGAGAQTMKPGLWEINYKSQGGADMDAANARMQKEMASMSPEQRKMMQDIMAKQGVAMGPGGGGGMTMRVCMTKEMTERHDVPTQKGDCKSTVSERSGNTVKMAFACTNPPSSGEGEMTYSSPEAFTMKMRMTSTDQGRSQKTSMEETGKWLGAECGDVKPVARPAR